MGAVWKGSMEVGGLVLTRRTLSNDRGKKLVSIVSSKVTPRPFSQPVEQKETQQPKGHRIE